MDALQFEKILVKLLFQNKDIREKIIPYLKIELFDDFVCKEIIKSILHFGLTYEKFPSIPDLKLAIVDESVFKGLTEILNIDTESYSEEFLHGELETFFKRKLIYNVVMDIVENLKTTGDTSKIANMPDTLREAVSFSFDTDIGLDFFEDAERIYDSEHNHKKFISSGLKTIDQWIDGGFHSKALTIWVGGTGVGKTLINCAFALNCLLHNHKVLYITLELPEEKIAGRITQNMFDMTREELRALDKKSFMDKFHNIQTTLKTKLVIREYPTMSANTNVIRNLLKELEVKKQFKPDIIFVDYLGIMAPNFRGKADNSYSEHKRIAQELRGLAMERDVPIVTATQVNRKGLGADLVDYDNMADSVGVAFDADVVISISQPDDLREQNKYMTFILKNRQGPDKIKTPINVDKFKMKIWDDVPVNGVVPAVVSKAVEEANKTNEAIGLIKASIDKDKQDLKDKIIEFK